MKKQHVTLSDSDRKRLNNLINKGTHPARVIKRAHALSALDNGTTLSATATQVHSTTVSVRKWRDRYNNGGLASALYDRPRSGRPIEIDGLERAKITALSTSDAPEGYARWSLRLLADKVVELNYCEHVSHTKVSNILKKTNSSLT